MSEPISPETDLNQVDPKNFGQGAISSSQDWVTTALPNELIVTRDWSRRNGVESEFLLLTDVAFLLDRPAATGSTISLLKSDLCIESLKDWALESLAAEQLLKLSEAVRRNPEVCKIIPPLSHGIKGIDIIRGQSEQLYLIGLLAARLPVLTNAEEKSWFEKLRLWLLVHAYERASNSILLDENLRILCTDLRLAHDSGASWLALFRRLAERPETMPEPIEVFGKIDGLTKKRRTVFVDLGKNKSMSSKFDEEVFLERLIEALREGTDYRIQIVFENDGTGKPEPILKDLQALNEGWSF